jgi:hypothetical protein
MRRRKDRFIQKIYRIDGARRRRRAFRRQQRAYRDSESLMQNAWEDMTDAWEFKRQELEALGKDLAVGVVREFASLGVDFLITFSTLGLVEPPSMRSARRRRRRR